MESFSHKNWINLKTATGPVASAYVEMLALTDNISLKKQLH